MAYNRRMRHPPLTAAEMRRSVETPVEKMARYDKFFTLLMTSSDLTPVNSATIEVRKQLSHLFNSLTIICSFIDLPSAQNNSVLEKCFEQLVINAINENYAKLHHMSLSSSNDDLQKISTRLSRNLIAVCNTKDQQIEGRRMALDLAIYLYRNFHDPRLAVTQSFTILGTSLDAGSDARLTREIYAELEEIGLDNIREMQASRAKTASTQSLIIFSLFAIIAVIILFLLDVFSVGAIIAGISPVYRYCLCLVIAAAIVTIYEQLRKPKNLFTPSYLAEQHTNHSLRILNDTLHKIRRTLEKELFPPISTPLPSSTALVPKLAPHKALTENPDYAQTYAQTPQRPVSSRFTMPLDQAAVPLVFPQPEEIPTLEWTLSNGRKINPNTVELAYFVRKLWSLNPTIAPIIEDDYLYWDDELVDPICGARCDARLIERFRDIAYIAHTVAPRGKAGVIFEKCDSCTEPHPLLKQLATHGSHYRIHFHEKISATDKTTNRLKHLWIPTLLSNASTD